MANKQKRARLELRRAACLAQAFRDLTLKEIRGKQKPFQRLMEDVAGALDWACPAPDGDLTPEQSESIRYASQRLKDLMEIAGASEDYSPTELLLSEIVESLDMAG